MPTPNLRIIRALARMLAGLLLVLPGVFAAAGDAARVSVAVPPAAQSAGVVMLELGLAVSRGSAATGHVGAVVRLGRPGGASAEVGRLSVVGEGGRYQFNVAATLKRLGLAGGSAEVEVALIERGGGPVPAGARLSIGHAQIVTR